MRFEHPWYFLLMLGAPLIAFLCWHLSNYRTSILQKLSLKIRERTRETFVAKSAALTLAWCLLVIALMNPQASPRFIEGNRSELTISGGRQTPQDVFIMIDASASMGVKDGRGGASRLDEAKEVSELLIQQLKGQNVGLYAFTGEATPLSPPTPDYLFTILTLREIKLNEGEAAGTDLSQPLDALLKQYGDDTTRKRHTVVLFSDGGDNSLDEKNSRIASVLKRAKDLSKKGWGFVVIGMGSNQGGPVPDVKYQGKTVNSHLDERLLRQIVQETQGKYFRADRSNKLDLSRTIAQTVTTEGEIKQEKSSPRQVVYKNYFQIPLALAGLLLMYVLFYPDARKEEL